MDQKELDAFYERLASLTQEGSEEKVRAYINEQYPRLPRDTRDEIMFNTLFTALQEEVSEQAAVLTMQEEGLAAAEFLEKVKISIENDTNLTN